VTRCGISHEKYKEVKSFAGTLKSKRIKFYCLEPVMGRNLDHSCKEITFTRYLESPNKAK
jgi:hypothetical protein